MMTDKLASEFIAELIAYSLINKDTFEIVKMYLKYSYLQKEEQKKLVQWLFRNYEKTGRIATILGLAPNTVSKYRKVIYEKYFDSKEKRTLEDRLFEMI